MKQEAIQYSFEEKQHRKGNGFPGHEHGRQKNHFGHRIMHGILFLPHRKKTPHLPQ